MSKQLIKQVNIGVDMELFKRILAIARAEDRTVSSFIRRLMREEVAKKADKRATG